MGPFVFLDVETTGIDSSSDSIIEIACIKWESGKVIGKYETLINPHRPIPPEITLLTGIKDTDVKEAPSFSDVKSIISEFIGDCPIVGHNITFDTGFLRSHKIQLEKNIEIDTVILACILLRNEESYALEVLAKKYNLGDRISHRAMADTQTTMDFFEFLLEKISAIPALAWPQLNEVLEKSKWPSKVIFEDRSCAKKIQSKPIPTEQKDAHIQPIIRKNWSEEVSVLFKEKNKILLESNNEIPFESLKNDKTIICYSSRKKKKEIMDYARAYGIKIKYLKDSNFYLSPEKLSVLLSKDKNSNEETPFLLKMILWNQETKTGDREEISLGHHEYGLFALIADEKGTDNFWQKNLNEAKESSVVLIHQGALAKGLQEKIVDADCVAEKNPMGLLITEASKLEESFTYAYRKKYTESILRPYFGDKATIIFGLLGIFYQKFVDPDLSGFNGNVVLDPQSTNSKEWKRVIEAANALPDSDKKNEFLENLTDASGKSIKWVNFFADEVIFQSGPISIAELFAKSIFPFSKIILQSSALSSDTTFGYIKNIFCLSDDWKEINENMADGENNPWLGNLKIEIPKNFPEPNTEGYFNRCLELFSQIIEKKQSAIIVLNSKKAVDAFYKNLNEKAKNEGVKLFGLGPSGGIGKSLSLFKQSPKNSVLMVSVQTLGFLEEIDDLIETIVFQKIPFDGISDPVLSARSKLFKDGFKDYTLPRAVMKFREILAELGKGAKQKTCYLLDSRLLNREYGRFFI